jgi:prepilin-type N-terminal cleavage/methylation domain-containing protein/prepilin-type processing-associated H-X9-DG protein
MVRSRNRLGFTLVELLVVVAIIGVIISLLLPSLRKARLAAYETVCISNMHQWGIAMQMYVDANHGQLPQKGPDGSSVAQSLGPITNGNFVIGYNDPSLWFNALPIFMTGKGYYQILLDNYHGLSQPPHDGDSSIWMCPLAGPAATTGADVVIPPYYVLNGIDSTGTIQTGTGMSNSKEFACDITYVFNSKLTSAINPPPTAPGTNPDAIKMSKLLPGSEVVIMTEKASNYYEYVDPTVQAWNAKNPSVYIKTAKMNAQGSLLNIAQTKADWTRFTTRHNSGGNLLFADGHVAWFAWTDAQYPASQITPSWTGNSNANQPGKLIWSAIGPVN